MRMRMWHRLLMSSLSRTYTVPLRIHLHFILLLGAISKERILFDRTVFGIIRGGLRAGGALDKTGPPILWQIWCALRVIEVQK